MRPTPPGCHRADTSLPSRVLDVPRSPSHPLIPHVLLHFSLQGGFPPPSAAGGGFCKSPGSDYLNVINRYVNQARRTAIALKQSQENSGTQLFQWCWHQNQRVFYAAGGTGRIMVVQSHSLAASPSFSPSWRSPALAISYLLKEIGQEGLRRCFLLSWRQLELGSALNPPHSQHPKHAAASKPS